MNWPTRPQQEFNAHWNEWSRQLLSAMQCRVVLNLTFGDTVPNAIQGHQPHVLDKFVRCRNTIESHVGLTRVGFRAYLAAHERDAWTWNQWLHEAQKWLRGEPIAVATFPPAVAVQKPEDVHNVGMLMRDVRSPPIVRAARHVATPKTPAPWHYQVAGDKHMPLFDYQLERS